MKKNIVETDKLNPRYFDGILFDSMDELYFYWWLLELKKRKVVLTIDTQVSFTLFNGDKRFGLEETKYTFDFDVWWSTSIKMDYFKKWPLPTHVEIKPDARSKGRHIDLHNNEYITNLKIKWLYQKTGVYVQVVRVIDLFKKTFVPVRCLKTIKINNSVLVDDFLNGIK
ncbi:MAG: hypothetical protein JW795_03315 [Chitinivibrionales bacterium]|nr:hypothetical protein [Chitinivibrionales bacterium]